ncbi:MAG: 4Fe-4S dicluster domain-containing protein [Bacteroidetes bacterium]|nr:4Fe-4S dicluster domain-containing protein [Bacteroidota bacterium]
MEEILDSREISVQKCYQCGKCSAGCPVAEDMDYPPSVIMRMVQTEDKAMEEAALRSMTIWLCVTCETCAARCPMEIDIPGVMDYLRQRSYEKGMANPKANHIISFHKAFLDSIDYTGRLYELGLIVDYKMRSFQLQQDVDLAPGMIARGKLGFFPELIKGRKNMTDIFRKTLHKKGGLK